MDRESVDRLRFDRRFEQRRDWVEEGAKEAHIESLPDVTEKMTRGLDEPEEAPAAAEPASPEVAPMMTSYSTPDPVSDRPPGAFGGGGSEPS
jgi:hypothetical protein